MKQPALSDLAKSDPRLRQLQFVALAFAVFPLIFSVVERGENFLPFYIDAMLYAFSWPLLLLLGMAAHRLAKLDGLVKGGSRRTGKVERLHRGGRPTTYSAEVTIDGARSPGTVRVYLSSSMYGSIREGSKVALLVDDPADPKVAVILDGN